MEPNTWTEEIRMVALKTEWKWPHCILLLVKQWRTTKGAISRPFVQKRKELMSADLWN